MEDDKLTKAIKKLSQYDEWNDICKYIYERRESKFVHLSGDNSERTDAKICGAIAEDDEIYATLSQKFK